MLRLATLAAAASAVAGASLDGTLFGLFNVNGVSSVIGLDLATGTNTTIAAGSVLNTLPSYYPAYSALDSSSSALEVAIAGAPAVFSVSIADGSVSNLAALPAYNQSDAFLGLERIGDQLLLIQQSSVWEVSGQEPVLLVGGLNFPSEAIVTSVPGAGTNGAGLLYVADQTYGSYNMFVIDVGAPGKGPSTLRAGVAAPMDLNYSPAQDSLLEAAHYVLYQTNRSTGASKVVTALPDGPGFPSTSGMSADGSIWWFIDFAHVFTVELDTVTVTQVMPFILAPRRIGMPHWVPNA